VNVIARSSLVAFWSRHPRSEGPLQAWYLLASRETWTGPQEIKRAFGTTVDFIGDNRAIFDIGGNKYRLIVHFSYKFKSCQIKFVGTHREYDEIDPLTVEIARK